MSKLVRLEDVEEIIDNLTKEFNEFRKKQWLLSRQEYTAMMVASQEIKENLSSLPTQNEWIDLEEEYPEDNTPVLATNGDYTDVCDWYASEHSWRWLWDSHIKYTHWMPLPLPPTN